MVHLQPEFLLYYIGLQQRTICTACTASGLSGCKKLFS